MLARKKSPIEQRERRLRRELGRLDARIRQMEKQRLTPPPPPPPPEKPSAPARKVAYPTGGQRELFTGPRKAVSAPAEPTRPQTPRLRAFLERLAPEPRSEETVRFTHYLSSGSFQTLQPLRHERRIRRNRAILMTFVAVILAFVVWYLWATLH